MTAIEPRLLGSQAPRIRVVPAGVDHPQWGEVSDFVDALGVELDVWQWDVLRSSLLRAEDLSGWAAFAIAVCAPRQNGKNGILEPRELVGPYLLGEKLLIHTAHLADTSKEGFRRLEDLLDANEWLSKDVRHIWRTNGHEAIEFRNGNRIRFRTRTRGGGRGFSGSPVFFDEPMFLPEISMGSILPVISAQPDPQVWYTGSAVDQTLHEDGLVFARVRARALAGEDKRLAYWEWSLDASSPDQVPEEVAGSPEVWAATNPALGVRITAGYVAAERRELDARTFAVERLGVGDWPDPSGVDSVFDLERWAELADPSSVALDPVCLAFDATPDRRYASIGAAGLRKDGLPHVEVIERRRGTGWVAERLQELDRAHSPRSIVYDGLGPAGSLVPEIEAAGVKVTKLGTREFVDGCGFIFDLVEESRLRHLGTTDLNAAVRVARSRPAGEAWLWSRKTSAGDISALVACTLALWGIMVQPSSVYEDRGLLVIGPA